MARKIPQLFSCGSDGVLLIKLKYSMISPLIVITDGLRVYSFSGEKTVYLSVKDVIDWHEKEHSRSGGKYGSLEAAGNLRKCLERHEREEEDLGRKKT